MCVDVRVAKWLNEQGHNALHLRDEGLQRLPNGRIFAKALAEERIVLTFDLDFGEIAALSDEQATSVIVLRLRNTRIPRLIERLSAVLPNVTEILTRSAVLIVEEDRYRVRYLPIGSDGDG